MKSIKILGALICAAAMSMVLAGCSSCSSTTTFDPQSLVGTYELYEIQGDNGTTHEEIETLHESGFSLFINLNEDKTFDFVFVGTDFTGTWECTDGKTMTFTPEEDSGLDMTDASYADGKITMTLYSAVTVFEKSDTKTVDSALSTSSSSSN